MTGDSGPRVERCLMRPDAGPSARRTGARPADHDGGRVDQWVDVRVDQRVDGWVDGGVDDWVDDWVDDARRWAR
ncbi:hypothetical protein GCM10027265_14980 [Jatrophihabitans fulvus]